MITNKKPPSLQFITTAIGGGVHINDLAKILGIDINQLKKLCNAFKKSGLKINPLQHLTKNIYLFKHHSILVVDNLTKIWL